MKIGVLTSSRADYGIYLPLLNVLRKDSFFDVEMLVFGTHTSSKHGNTVHGIKTDGFKIGCELKTVPETDSPKAIAKSMALTINRFTEIWEDIKYDLVIALGDRFEMFAAVSSLIPFNIPVAHIHGGETTLGAIDNAYRHSITAMSEIHFTTCDQYKKRVVDIVGNEQNVFNVGALSIDLLSKMQFLSQQEFFELYHIDLTKPTVLFTFHPETVGYNKNKEYINTIVQVLSVLKDYQIVITMPNTDTMGNLIRENLNAFIHKNSNTFGIESFGSLGYLSCMKYCSFMLGNTSSGFVEAVWFPKAVINLGERQKGRIETPNIYSCPIEYSKMIEAISWATGFKATQELTIYGDGNAANKIIMHLKEFFLKQTNTND